VERFAGVLVEHYAGAFPVWLAPEQVRIVPIADRHAEHARGLAHRFGEEGLRALVDDSRETVGKKVREAQRVKVPYTIVVGDQEVSTGAVAVRDRSGQEEHGVPFERFVAQVIIENQERALESSVRALG
jgi:threonyl-tRNA synthetase